MMYRTYLKVIHIYSVRAHLDDWGDELLYKVVFDQLGPVVVDEVDHKTYHSQQRGIR